MPRKTKRTNKRTATAKRRPARAAARHNARTKKAPRVRNIGPHQRLIDLENKARHQGRELAPSEARELRRLYNRLGVGFMNRIDTSAADVADKRALAWEVARTGRMNPTATEFTYWKHGPWGEEDSNSANLKALKLQRQGHMVDFVEKGPGGWWVLGKSRAGELIPDGAVKGWIPLNYERGRNPSGDYEDYLSRGTPIMLAMSPDGTFTEELSAYLGRFFHLRRHDDGDLTASIRDANQTPIGAEVVVPEDQIADVYHYALHHGTMEGWEPGSGGYAPEGDEEDEYEYEPGELAEDRENPYSSKESERVMYHLGYTRGGQDKAASYGPSLSIDKIREAANWHIDNQLSAHYSKYERARPILVAAFERGYYDGFSGRAAKMKRVSNPQTGFYVYAVPDGPGMMWHSEPYPTREAAQDWIDRYQVSQEYKDAHYRVMPIDEYWAKFGMRKSRSNPAALAVHGRGWIQESYETAGNEARKRAATLRKLGYQVIVSGMGRQVTPVGSINLTMVDIRPGTSGDAYLEGVPPAEVVRWHNPASGVTKYRITHQADTIGTKDSRGYSSQFSTPGGLMADLDLVIRTIQKMGGGAYVERKPGESQPTLVVMDDPNTGTDYFRDAWNVLHAAERSPASARILKYNPAAIPPPERKRLLELVWQGKTKDHRKGAGPGRTVAAYDPRYGFTWMLLSSLTDQQIAWEIGDSDPYTKKWTNRYIRERNPNPTDYRNLTDAFNAGKEFRTSGAYYETGVANARVAKYGFNKWLNEQPKSVGGSKARLMKEFMEGWAAGKRWEGAEYKRNPADGAAALYEEFHGVPSESETIIEEDVAYHGHLTQLGKLIELKVTTLSGYKVVLDFTNDGVLLCASEDGRQLYFRGGRQDLDLAAINMNADEFIKDLMVIGDITEVSYETAKKADGMKKLTYFHRLKDKDGAVGTERVYPVLLFDTMNAAMSMAGGSYATEERGLVG